MPNTARLKDVAARAGVSRVAAGAVLLGSGSGHVRVSETTADRIRKHAVEMGYQPNRSAQRLRGGPGSLLGVIIQANAPEIELKRLVALEKLACMHEHQLIITAVDTSKRDSIHKSVHSLATQGPDAIAFITAGAAVADFASNASKRIPVVCCDIPPLLKHARGVALNMAPGHEAAIQHLISSGRKRIGVLNSSWMNGHNPYCQYRMRCLKRGLQKTARADEVSIVAMAKDLNCQTDAESAATEFLNSGVDAVMANSDINAARLMKALSSCGAIIPDDVAICGMSNSEISELLSPALTTIDEKPEAVAQAMLELMLKQIAGDDNPLEQRAIDAELIVRESTACSHNT